MGDWHRCRAEWHDYYGGIYFVTICTADKRQLFGSIREDVLVPTQLGRLVEEQITALPTHYPDVELWNHVVMPNHIHIVLAVWTRLIGSIPVWQSRYHDHIIRNQHAYDNITNYIDRNPANWLQDCLH